LDKRAPPASGEGRNNEGNALAIGADVRFRDDDIPAGEEWYYELDGRAHGPMRWSDLEELLGRAGETAAQIRVRQGADGPWSAFRSDAQATSTPTVGAQSAERFEQSPAARPLVQSKSGGITSFFGQHRDLWAVVGIWVLLNVLFILYWPQPYAKERRYLATLQDVVKEADQLRAGGATDTQWASLAKRTKERLAPMIADLKKSASSSELPRQQLLWSARDLVPKIMGPQSKEREQNESRLKQYLQSVEQAVGHP
jgi:hypothetical protein